MKRRDAIKSLSLAGAAAALRLDVDAQGQPLTVAGKPVELRLSSLSPATMRVVIVARDDAGADLNRDGALATFYDQRVPATAGVHEIGRLKVTVRSAPLAIEIADAAGRRVQEL